MSSTPDNKINAKRGRKPKRTSNEVLRLIPDREPEFRSNEYTGSMETTLKPVKKKSNSLILQLTVGPDFDHAETVKDVTFGKIDTKESQEKLTSQDLEKIEELKKGGDITERLLIQELIRFNRVDALKKLISRSTSLEELIKLREIAIEDHQMETTPDIFGKPNKNTFGTSEQQDPSEGPWNQSSNSNKDFFKRKSFEKKIETNPDYTYIFNPNTTGLNGTKFTTIYNTLPEFTGEKWPKKTNIHCWWCCFPFDTIPIPIPTRYYPRKDIFKVYGCFCSVNCAYSYTKLNTNYKLVNASLLLFMYNKITKSRIRTLKEAPERTVLNIFGGPLTIQKFRESFHYMREYNSTSLPFIYMSSQIQEVSIKTNAIESDSTLTSGVNSIISSHKQLKRNKPTPTSRLNIESLFKK